LDRLFVYGSLQPGGANEHVLKPLAGQWHPATIQGYLREQGWGADLWYPGIVLTSAWRELDAFEGHEYERVLATVELIDGNRVAAYVYVLREPVSE
jgi:gamma-glutamylcyclotransferase (GGCT)/AIG2-like uncharacterized protein YtfP